VHFSCGGCDVAHEGRQLARRASRTSPAITYQERMARSLEGVLASS